ncbi:hypothetical protein AAMO2058_000784300 [Amorphochlora amoebiformis]
MPPRSIPGMRARRGRKTKATEPASPSPHNIMKQRRQDRLKRRKLRKKAADENQISRTRRSKRKGEGKDAKKVLEEIDLLEETNLNVHEKDLQTGESSKPSTMKVTPSKDTLSKPTEEVSFNALSPIAVHDEAHIPTTSESIRMVKKLEIEEKEDPYLNDSHNAARFKPSKRNNKVSPATAKVFEERSKKYYNQIKEFYAEVDAQGVEDFFEIE